MSDKLPVEEQKKRFNKIADDIISPITHHGGLKYWVFLLSLILTLFGYAYFIQVKDGLGVTGMHDYAAWGMYIANFVFFTARRFQGLAS